MEKARSIYDYNDYRAYLKDLYLDAKSKGRKYSFGYFSKLLGFSSKSFFKHVIDGHRNLSEESIERFCKALKLNRDESSYFKNLVLFNQATTSEEKMAFSREIFRSRAFRKIHPLKISQFQYLTHWYFVAIRELVNLPHFKEDPEWISQNTLPKITPAQAKQAIEELQKLGLLTRNENGKLVQANAIVATSDEVTSASVAQYHRELMKKASESIDSVPREKRDISGVTFRISGQTAKKIKEMIQTFRKELAEEASHDTSPDAVYQLNLQLFPLSQIQEDKEVEKK